MNQTELLQTIETVDPHTRYGKVRQIVGLIVEAVGPEDVALGELCYLGDPARGGIRAEVVGFNGSRVLLTPLGEIEGIRPGTAVFPTRSPLRIAVGRELTGRILNGLGNPLDGRGQIHAKERRNVHNPSPDPLSRRRLSEPLGTGVRAIDGLMTLGKGQRMGIFAGSGVGKSTLLGMIARSSEADVNVIALVGERGKEVIEFIELACAAVLGFYLAPPIVGVWCLAYLAGVAATRILVVGQIVATAALPIAAYFFFRDALVPSYFITALVLVRHAPRIKSVLNGTEPKMYYKIRDPH